MLLFPRKLRDLHPWELQLELISFHIHSKILLGLSWHRSVFLHFKKPKSDILTVSPSFSEIFLRGCGYAVNFVDTCVAVFCSDEILKTREMCLMRLMTCN